MSYLKVSGQENERKHRNAALWTFWIGNARGRNVKMRPVKLLMAVAIICILISSAFITSSSKCASNDKMAGPCWQAGGPEIPIAPLRDYVSSQLQAPAFGAGRGVAFGSDCLYPVKIQLARVRSLRPLYIRELLRENKSIEEIIVEIAKIDEVFVYQGHMRLSDNDYKLVDINVTEYGDDYILDAEVMELRGGIMPLIDGIIAGHIWINSTVAVGTTLHEGKLVIHRGQRIGNYTLLLDMTPAARSVMRCPMGPPPVRGPPIGPGTAYSKLCH